MLSSPTVEVDVEVDRRILPCAANDTFHEASFFKSPGAFLPSPAQVREDAKERMQDQDDPTSRLEVMQYPALGLVVKFGHDITVAEGQCLWFMKRYLRYVPVPEIFGWKTDGGQTFLYMQYVHGDTVAERWTALSELHRAALVAQLRRATTALKSLRQPRQPYFLGRTFRLCLMSSRVD